MVSSQCGLYYPTISLPGSDVQLILVTDSGNMNVESQSFSKIRNLRSERWFDNDGSLMSISHECSNNWKTLSTYKGQLSIQRVLTLKCTDISEHFRAQPWIKTILLAKYRPISLLSPNPIPSQSVVNLGNRMLCYTIFLCEVFTAKGKFIW